MYAASSDNAKIKPEKQDTKAQCVLVTAQDGKTFTTYQIIFRLGDPSPEHEQVLVVPELIEGYDHDRVYFDQVDAGSKQRLRVRRSMAEEHQWGLSVPSACETPSHWRAAVKMLGIIVLG